MSDFGPASAGSSSAFYEVFIDAPRKVVLLRRTAQRYSDDAEVAKETERLSKVLDVVGRIGRRLLVDAREAPTDTDVRMGAAFRSQRLEVRRDFKAVAIVVKTQVGKLQANRLVVELGQGKVDRVFTDFHAALAYLQRADALDKA